MYGITPSRKFSIVISNLKWEPREKNGLYSTNWKVSIHCWNALIMISHQLVIYVISMKMVKCYQLQLCKNFTTSDGMCNDDNKWTNPLSESNSIYQTNKHFMK